MDGESALTDRLIAPSLSIENSKTRRPENEPGVGKWQCNKPMRVNQHNNVGLCSNHQTAQFNHTLAH